MPTKSYLNFDLLLNQVGDSYQVHVIDSPAGQASQTFTLPFSALELENFILKIGQNRGGVRSLHLETLDVPSVKKLGGALYDCIFGGAVAERFRSSLALARHEGQGLRIRLRLSGAPALTDIPWELMFDAANNNYVGLSVNTPIVRQLDLATQPDTRQAVGALQVLVMIASPANYPPLDVEREWERINSATQGLQAQGRLVLTRVEPSLAALQQQLRKGEYHIFHYIGHGGFDRSSNDGVLVLEDEQKKGHLVSGQYLGAILYDQATIQLALLNSCSGGRTSVTDPFAGVGQSLLQKGIPAVIAMQFEITDEAAITFSHEFYAALADGYPVDAAVAEARKMIYAKANQLEWATPVLYMSTDTGVILHEPIAPRQEKESMQEEKLRQTFKPEPLPANIVKTTSQKAVEMRLNKGISLLSLATVVVILSAMMVAGWFYLKKTQNIPLPLDWPLVDDETTIKLNSDEEINLQVREGGSFYVLEGDIEIKILVDDVKVVCRGKDNCHSCDEETNLAIINVSGKKINNENYILCLHRTDRSIWVGSKYKIMLSGTVNLPDKYKDRAFITIIN
jgi:hypothetical protein